MRLCTAGSIGAALAAMRFGWGINLGGYVCAHVRARRSRMRRVAVATTTARQRRAVRPRTLLFASALGSRIVGAGGFCVYADITLMVQNVRHHFPYVRRVLIIDLDAHQGAWGDGAARNAPLALR